MGDTLRSILPPIYGDLLPELFDGPAIEEPRATCDDCAMCEGNTKTTPPGPSGHFRPDVKCCTFHPALPNFLVGALFEDPDPALEEGKRRLREKIKGRVGVTPQWISPPRKLRVFFEAARNMSVFGRTKSILCPYYIEEGGLCSVWRYRESICSTYFCKYENGMRGYAFWTKLKSYLTHLETMLSRYAVAQIDSTLSEPNVPHLKITLEDLEDKPPLEADYAKCWGKWVGREEELYIESARRVRALGRDGLARLVEGSKPIAETFAQLAPRYRDVTSDQVPPHLVPNPRMRSAQHGDKRTLTTFNPCDSYPVDEKTFDAIRAFEADVPVKKVLKRLKQKKGVELSPALVRELVVNGVLVPPDVAAKGDDEEGAKS
jgi:Fe-S-cluster containining protein